MTKLTDTQTIILSAASQRDGHIALPLPDSLRGDEDRPPKGRVGPSSGRSKGTNAAKVVGLLLAKGFLEEVEADTRNGEPVWRETGDGHGVTLIATDTGLAAIGIEIDSAEAKPTEDPTPEPRTPREGTKQATLIAMLRAPDGATIAEIMDATGWQSHTVRGAMSGALKKKLGLEVTSEKVEDRGRVYKIAS
jgi:hypothetical protein